MSAFRTPARRLAGGLSAGLAAAALVALSAGPGAAATVVAQATASALVVTVAGQSQDSGTYTVSNDGKTETSSGTNAPPAAIPSAGTVNVGVLAQDAATQVVNRNGRSAACSGIAGQGGTVVAVGDESCITPGGDTLSLGSGTLDLPSLVAQGQAAIPQQLTDALMAIPGLGGVLGQVGAGGAAGLTQLQTVIQGVLAAIGDPTLALNAGAIQSTCTAQAPSDAAGDATLADVSLNASIRLPGQTAARTFSLVTLPVNPEPNTEIVTGLDTLVTQINRAVTAQLTTGLDGLAAPLATAIAPFIDQINSAVIAQIADQLAPVEDNLLRGTLNKQERTPGAIEVTALDVQVLPAAQAVVGSSLISAQVANVTCGPSGRVAPPTSSADPVPSGTPAVPTFVPAGEAGTAAPRTDDNGLNGVLAMSALGGLAVVSAGAGVAAYRKTSSR